MLKRRPLGKSGIEVSEIGMGLWAAGGGEWGPAEDRDTLSAIDRALELGVNFFDTADVYGGGHSEEVLGRAMEGRRDRFLVATKIGWIGFDQTRKSSAYTTIEKLMAGVEQNLRRLRTDHVELLQCHIDFPHATLDVFLKGFEKMKQQGKVRAWGVSTSDLGYLKSFCADGNAETLQIDYSILNRTPEGTIFPYVRERGLGVIVRGALAMGILSGKMNAATTFAESDFRSKWTREPVARAVFEQDLAKVERLRSFASGRTLSQLALQFALAQPAVSTVIPGGRMVRQVEENVQAAALPPLTPEEFKAIEAVTPNGGGRKIWPA